MTLVEILNNAQVYGENIFINNNSLYTLLSSFFWHLTNVTVQAAPTTEAETWRSCECDSAILEGAALSEIGYFG